MPVVMLGVVEEMPLLRFVEAAEASSKSATV
jgi:hypothetical protein